MAEEIRQKGGRSVVLAMHPGEVETFVFPTLFFLHFLKGLVED
jgi:hypothetical protein